MTEREKMQEGLLYDANYNAELLKERERCKDLCFAYNQLRPTLVKEQEKIIRQLFGKTGKRFYITAPSGVTTGATSRSARISTPTQLHDSGRAKVTFGDHVFIARTASSPRRHPSDAEQRNQGLEYATPSRWR